MTNTKPQVQCLAIASDRSGFPLKKAICDFVQNELQIQLLDFGLASEAENSPYDEQAIKVAEAIQEGRADRGILICGTGQGMAIVANKHKGIYAVVADSVFAGDKGRVINNTNVLTMGGWITAPPLGIEIVHRWLSLDFTETMPDRAEWLKSAFHRVRAIEDKNFV